MASEIKRLEEELSKTMDIKTKQIAYNKTVQTKKIKENKVLKE